MKAMFNQNDKLVQLYFKAQYEYIRHFTEEYNQGTFEVKQAKNGLPILSYQQAGKVHHLSSQYDPLKEAGMIVNRYGDMEKGHVLFYGLGMGYHIELFLKKFPHITYSIYEPNPEVFYHFLQHRDIRLLQPQRCKALFLHFSDQHLPIYAETFASNLYQDCTIVILPAYERFFEKELAQFLQVFSIKIKTQKETFLANRGYSYRWTANAVHNFKYVLETPCIFDSVHLLKGKPALLISAGPSLSFELETIKKIYEDQSAFLVGVGSSNKALLAHGITPHLLATYDPNSYNLQVYEEVNRLAVPPPLAFGSTVGYETIKNYKGPLFHMITNQDTIFPYFFKNQVQMAEQRTIHDAPTIAAVALEMLAKLGCNPIILVGQNFGFLDNKYYADGIGYAHRPTELQAKDLSHLVEVMGVNGEKVKTIEAHNVGRNQMEVYIQALSTIGVNVINTTKGGAGIAGTTYRELEQVMEEFHQDTISIEWYKELKKAPIPLELLMDKMNVLEKGKVEIGLLQKEFIKVYRQLDKSKKSITEIELQKKLKRLNKLNKRIVENDYFMMFYAPILRVQYDYLVKTVQDIPLIANQIEKIDRIVTAFGGFTVEMMKVQEEVDALFEEICMTIKRR